MAKKVVADGEEKDENAHQRVKKKRSKCCTCCLIFCIVVLVLLIAAFGVGWYFGDKFTKQELGMSLGDTFGVLGDLYWTDDSDVVKRPFGNKDLDGFYSEIKRNILLKDDAEVDFDGALNDAIEKYLASDSQQDPVQAARADEGSTDGGGDGKSEITDIFVDMIVGVLNRDNIDIERLNAYNEADPSSDEYIFNLNDKQLAAFINSVLKNVLKNANKIDGMSDITDMVDVSKVVSLKQIRFKAKSEKTDSGESVVSASSADVTLWLGLQSAANQAIRNLLEDEGFGWAGGIVGWLGNVILPENIYLTLDIPLYGDGAAKIVINDMNASEQARANKLINGILGMTGNNKKLDDILADLVEKIKPFLTKATEKMDFSEAGKGTIAMDLLQTVAEMASENLEGEPLTKANFLYVLQALLSDKEKQLESLTPYRYDNWYTEGDKIVYRPTGGDPANKIDYEEAFINEIENKYAIDFGENKDLNSVLEMLGISLDGSNGNFGSTDLLDKVDGKRFKELLNVANVNSIKLNITDRMLGAALSKQTDKIMNGVEGLENVKISLDALSFIRKSDPKKADHEYALLAVEADLSGMISTITDGNGLVGKLVTGLMPESILLTVTVDITRDRSVTRDEAEFVINSCNNTDRVIETLEKLVPSLKFGEISAKISDTLNDMLDQMDSLLNLELKPSTYAPDAVEGWVGDSGALVLPDIFSVVTDTVLVKEQPDGTKDSIVTADQLKNVIRDLNSPGVTPSDIPTDGYSEFIAEVMSKYYFKATAEPVKTFDDLTRYMSEFDSSKFEINGAKGLAHDMRPIDSDVPGEEHLTPIMSGGQLGALIKEQMSGNSAVEDYDIISVTTGDNELGVTLAVDLGKLLVGAEQVRKLIDADKLYVTALFSLDDSDLNGDGTPEHPFGYKVSMRVNVEYENGTRAMDDDTFAAMMSIVEFFVPDFDIQKQMDEVGVILYEQMQNLNDSIASAATADGGSTVETPTERKYFRFTERGLEIVDFYTFLMLKMKPSLLETSDAETVKKTVQGLYAKDAAAVNPDNFDVNDIIFNAPSGEEWKDGSVSDVFGKPHLDSDFNSFLKDGVESIANEGEVTVEQTIILAKGDSGATAQAVRAWLNGKLKQNTADPDYITADNDYVAITFSMSMANYIGKDKDENGDEIPSDNIAAGLFPTEIYATVVFRYNGSTFTQVPENASADVPVLIFNNMSRNEYHVMVELMGATPDSSDEEKVNIVSITKKSADVLNGIKTFTVAGMTFSTDITFAAADNVPDGKHAVGQITITPKTP